MSPPRPALFDASITARTDGAVTVTVAGEVDCAAVEAVRDVLVGAIDAATGRETILVDLGQVTFIDCAGLSALTAAVAVAAARNVALSLEPTSPLVARLLELAEAPPDDSLEVSA